MRAPVVAFVVAVATGIVWPADGQEALTRTDSQGPVAVTVTLAAPPAAGKPIEARVALDTHSVALDAVAFERAVALRTPDGAEVLPTSVEAKGAGHHREARVVFPPVAGPGRVLIVVKDVGGVAERAFPWELR